MLPNRKDEFSLKFVDGLSWSCGNEQIIVSTTDHRDRHDAALLPMDTYIHKASPQPVGLPDGGEIVQLQSIGEKSLVDFDATNNRGQSGVLVSNSKKKYTLEVSRERCMTQSLLSLVESTRRISMDFDSPDNREHLNSPVVFNSEKEDMREASKGECSTKNALSLDDSTKQNSFPDFDATINKAHLVEAYHSGPVVSLSENKNSGGALNRECIGKSVLCLEDLRQHCCGRCDDVEKSFGDSLAWTSFEVLETLAPWEQPNDCVPLLSLGRSTLGSCVQQEKSLDLPRVMQIDAVGQRVTKSSRYLEGFAAQSASSSRWPIGLPDGAHSVLLDPLEQSTQDIVHLAGAEQCSSTVSLPEKKMVRTLKRKYKTISVIVENHQQQQSVALPDGGEIVGLDSSVKKPLVDFDATTNMGFQSGVLVSYSKRRCMTLSGISGFYRTYSLAQKSFEVQETLLPPKQLRNSADTARVRQIRTLMHEEPSDPRGSFPIHMHTLIGRFQRYLCPSLCPSICIRSIFWEEPNDFVPLWSPRRLTFKGCVQLEKTPYLPRLLQIDAVEQELTKSPRYSGGSTAQDLQQSLLSYCSGEWDALSYCSGEWDALSSCSGEWDALSSCSGEWDALSCSGEWVAQVSPRPDLGGQYRSGSSTSHSQNERTRDQPEGRKRKIKNLTIEDLRPYVRLPRAQAARELQVSESTFKRVCRRLKIEQWPKLPPREVIIPPDQNGEKNPSPMFITLSNNGFITLSNNGQITTENEMGGQNLDQNTIHDSHHGHCGDAGVPFPDVNNGAEVAGGSGNILEQLFESISDLALSQAMPITPITTESSEFWRDTLTSVEGHLLGSQSVPSNPHMTPLLTERQDSTPVKLNATYGEDLINLYLPPLMPGIMELKQAVSKQLGLGLDSFKVKYENERGKWILMTHDEDVRELLRLTSSENQDSNRLKVIKVPNITDFCSNCECDKCRSLKGKGP